MTNTIAALGRLCMLGVLTASDTSTGAAAQTPAVLDVTLCDADRIPAVTSREIVREAIAVFRDAAITLRFETSTGIECGMGGRAAVMVRVEHAPVPYRELDSKVPMASIDFIDGRPGRTITLSVSGARHLIRRDGVTRSLVLRVSPRVEQQWVGRMLGRALAHELGHYLLRSPLHSATGLMRASHTASAFLDPARTAFRITSEHRQALLFGVTEGVATAADASQR